MPYPWYHSWCSPLVLAGTGSTRGAVLDGELFRETKRNNSAQSRCGQEHRSTASRTHVLIIANLRGKSIVRVEIDAFFKANGHKEAERRCLCDRKRRCTSSALQGPAAI